MAMFYRHSRDPFQKETPNYPFSNVANRFQTVFPEPKNLELSAPPAQQNPFFNNNMIYSLQRTTSCGSCNGAK